MDAASDTKDLIERINSAPGTTGAIPVAKRTEARNRLDVLKKITEAKWEVSGAKEIELRHILSSDSSSNDPMISKDDMLVDGLIKAWIIGAPVVLNSSSAVGSFPM